MPADRGPTHLPDSFFKTTLRRLSTNFGSTASAEEVVNAKEVFDKSRGYNQFKKHECKKIHRHKPPPGIELIDTLPPDEKAPPGFPRLSKYISSNENYEVWRGFRDGHVRHLLRYQAEITELEKALEQLDKDDDANPDMRYRLQHTKHKSHWDTKRRDLEEEHRVKLLEFGEETTVVNHDTRMED